MAVQPMLLAFAGNDKGMGAFMPGMKKAFKKAAKYHPASMALRVAKAARHGKLINPLRGDAFGLDNDSKYYYGNEDLYFGKGKFLPGLTKTLKKVGKVTRPFTTAVAKSFLPAGVVDMIAMVDPTKKGGASGSAAVRQTAALISQNMAPVTVQSAPSTPANPTGNIEKEAALSTLKNPIFLGVAGVGIAAIVFMAAKKRR